MKTGIIIAGGKSSRMGEDKALINSNVERLASELRKSGCDRIIIMCGDETRATLFDEECIPDSTDCLALSIVELVSNIEGTIQLAPCDAYLADAELFSRIEGVPVDDSGDRQPLLAGFDSDYSLRISEKISNVFEGLPSCEGGIKARNINTKEQIKEIEYLLKPSDR